MGYGYNQESQKQALIGNIMGLMKELRNLAPHPDCPSYKGPLFIQSNPNFKLPNEHDGLLGSMIMEGILGVAFSEAVSDMVESATQSFDLPEFDIPAGVDLSNLMDVYSEYMTDGAESKEKKKHAEAHGQGTLASLAGKSVSKGFNMRASISEGMQSFLDDLPKRMMIERNMAYYAKQLDLINHVPANQYASASSMAA